MFSQISKTMKNLKRIPKTILNTSAFVIKTNIFTHRL